MNDSDLELTWEQWCNLADRLDREEREWNEMTIAERMAWLEGRRPN